MADLSTDAIARIPAYHARSRSGRALLQRCIKISPLRTDWALLVAAMAVIATAVASAATGAQQSLTNRLQDHCKTMLKEDV